MLSSLLLNPKVCSTFVGYFLYHWGKILVQIWYFTYKPFKEKIKGESQL